MRSIAFSPDGRRLLSGSLDGTARLWAVEEALSLEGGVDLIEVAAHKGYSRPMPRCR